MKKANIVEFTDLLSHAVTIGYCWNQAHEILVKDEVPPMYECKKREMYLEEIGLNGYSEDTMKILTSFFEENKVTEFTIIG